MLTRRTTRSPRLAAVIVSALAATLPLAACAASGNRTATPRPQVTAGPAGAGHAQAADSAPAAGQATAATQAGPDAAAAPGAAARAAAQSASADPSATAHTAAPGASPTGSQAASAGAGGGSSAASAPGARRVTFASKVKQTIWVAAAPDPKHPLARTGWVLRAGQSLTVTVPNQWNGRFWGRTGCVFHGGRGHCQTGDCGGRFQCTGYGAIPATLAEYDLDAWDNLDFYDVSMVDGSNLPMYINVTRGQASTKVSRKGCVPAGCTKPVACPAALRIKAGGKVVACESACAKLGGNQYCCRGKWAPRAACNPKKWPVDYAAVFKRAEPYAYSYVDDDATSVYVCKGDCYYRIVFGVTPAD